MEIPSSGISRVDVEYFPAGEIIENGTSVFVSRPEFGKVLNVPEPQIGVYLIVSRLVAAALPNRNDVFIPGSLIRDLEGRVIACNGLSRL